MQVWLGAAALLVLLQLAPSGHAQGKGSLKFEVYKDAKEEFRWRLKSANGKIIATGGQGYAAKADCKRGIEILKEAGAKGARSKFELYQDAKEEYRWRLKAANGQVVAVSSQGYSTKAGCEKSLTLVRKAGKAPLEEVEK
ncbi:MAG: DUF1508 domain-containing protein [Planctomycetes bacterium]|nr:DUF1508 domain-containing protein [Planctomycetota bacterium]